MAAYPLEADRTGERRVSGARLYSLLVPSGAEAARILSICAGALSKRPASVSPRTSGGQRRAISRRSASGGRYRHFHGGAHIIESLPSGRPDQVDPLDRE